MSSTRSNKPFWIFSAVLMPIVVSGSLFVGAVLFTAWTAMKTPPSIGLLLKYWPHRHALADTAQIPFYASLGLSVFLMLLPFFMFLMTAATKPRKELHGSSRFATLAEIRQSGLIFPKKPHKPKNFKDTLPDLLVGKIGNEFLRFKGDEFVYLAAPTRSGKGVGVVIPNCLHYYHSMVVYDPKFENFLITAGYRKDVLKQDVFLFAPGGRLPMHTSNPSLPLMSHRYNPFSYVSRDARFTYSDLTGMAEIILPKSNDSGGSNATQFFVDKARQLFVGLGMYLIETENDRDLKDYTQRTTLSNLMRLTVPLDGRTLPEWIRDTVEHCQTMGKPLSSQCKTLLLGFANEDNKTGANILSSMNAPMALFLDPVVEAATSADDFRLDEVRKKPMTVYIGIVPSEAEKYSRLTNLLFSQLIGVNVQQGLPDKVQELKYQCLLLLDEFTALGVIKAVQHGVSYIAGYGLRLMMIIQSPAQVASLYGEKDAQTFFTNFGCRIFFTPRELNDAKEYSALIGYYTYKSKSKSRSSGKGSSSRSTSESDQKRAVLNEDEIRQMPLENCVINLNGRNAVYAEKIVYHEDAVLKSRAFMPPPAVHELDLKHDTAAESGSKNNADAEQHNKNGELVMPSYIYQVLSEAVSDKPDEKLLLDGLFQKEYGFASLSEMNRALTRQIYQLSRTSDVADGSGENKVQAA